MLKLYKRTILKDYLKTLKGSHTFCFLLFIIACLCLSPLEGDAQNYARKQHSHVEHTKLNKKVTTLETDIQKDSLAIKQNQDKILENTKTIEELKDGIISDNQTLLNRFWIIIAAVLVFLMQAGFTAFESGLVGKEHQNEVGLKNIIDWLVVCLVFYAFGFAIMFGDFNLFFLTGIESANATYSYDFFIFQLVFACTAVTIISGALSGRIEFIHYIIIAFFVGGFVYPTYGHWVWGDIFIETNEPFLGNLGFMDFAGSAVVHVIGACIAFIGIMAIGPRKNRFKNKVRYFSNDPQILILGVSALLITFAIWFLGQRFQSDLFNISVIVGLAIFGIIVGRSALQSVARNTSEEPDTPLISSNLAYSAVGVFILWFGWWGFNGGSNLAFDGTVSKILINTNLAGAAGGLSAFIHASWKGDSLETKFTKAMGGILGGLVAITASANLMSPTVSILIGALAGIIHNLAYEWLIRLKLDDPVSAVPVHGACGMLGIILLILGNPHQFSKNETAFQDYAQAVLSTAATDTSDNKTITIGDLDASPAFTNQYKGDLKSNALPDSIQSMTLATVYEQFLTLNYLQREKSGAQPKLDNEQINTYLAANMSTFPFSIKNFSRSALPQRWWNQLLDQILGILVAMVFAFGVSLLLFLGLKQLGLGASDPMQSLEELL